MSKLKGDLAPKTPYELRADLLNMAIGILETQTRQRAENEYMKPDHVSKEPIEPFTLDQVLEVASSLNKFVTNG